MQIKTSFIATSMILMLLIVLAACGGDSDGGGESQSDESEPAATPTPTLTNFDMGGNTGVLAWVGDARAPGDQNLAEPGSLVLVEANGDLNTISALPSGTNRIYACGDQSTSVDGRYFAFYVGGDDGTLYLADGNTDLYAVDQIDALGCIGTGAFEFSPDGQNFAYIDFADNTQTDPVAQGFLYVRDSASRDERYSFDNVAAFDISDTQVAYVGVFSDYNEAALTVWEDGNTDEVGTFFSDQNCTFSSAGVSLFSDDEIVVLLGQRCSGSGTTWQLYTGDTSGGGVSEVLSGSARGSFFSESRTNALFASQNGDVVYYAIPNGIARNIVNMRQVIPTEPEEGEDLVEDVLMPRFTSRLYNPDDNALPIVSPNGSWAVVTSEDVNGNVAITVFDLVDTTAPPLTLNPVGRGEKISSIAFTPDSQRLLFVAGGTDGEDNSLFMITLATGADERLIRGRFGQVIPSGESTHAILTEWRVTPDPGEPSYLNLIRMNLDDPDDVDTLFEGAEVVDDQVNDQRFIYPLSWRGVSE